MKCINSITVTPSSITVKQGSWYYGLYATVCPTDAECKSVKWTSSNPSVASVNESNGYVYGISAGTAVITATATDGCGASDSCTVTVTGDVLVSNVVIRPNMGYMDVGDTKVLRADILPNNATNKEVVWRSDDPNIITVNQSSGLIRAVATGNTTVYATACDGSGAVGSCNITVKPFINVEAVTVCPQNKTIGVGDSVSLCATVCPENATNKNIIWTSSDEDIASVDASSGTVTGISGGEVYIYATSEDGSKTGRCEITVDSREKVIIKKDSHSFYVEFADGKIWKYIGLDLSKREDYYNMLNRPIFDIEFYDDLIVEEQRYLDNIYVEENGIMENKTYSVKQIAYLYLVDPIGIEYYMRYNACHDKDIMSGEFLSYKDEVYEAIFGNSERLSGRFYFTIVDGSVRYGRYSGAKRMDVYSNAEIIFGSHTIFNWSSFWQSIGETIFENIPVISHILLGVEMYQALFYSGSIVSAMSGVASEFLDDYAKETENTVLEKMLGWPKTVFDCFTALADALVGAFELNNLKDMDIYAKIQEQDYRTVFDRYGSELTIQEIISKCTNA